MPEMTAKAMFLDLVQSLPDDTAAEQIERQVSALLHRVEIEFGKAGHELAVKTWPVEDFLDWQRQV